MQAHINVYYCFYVDHLKVICTILLLFYRRVFGFGRFLGHEVYGILAPQPVIEP